jgi:hypothetical protein
MVKLRIAAIAVALVLAADALIVVVALNMGGADLPPSQTEIPPTRNPLAGQPMPEPLWVIVPPAKNAPPVHFGGDPRPPDYSKVLRGTP